ncbi:MAG: twin-arginine translocation signal domain-containing protein, partial [Fimbriimonadaceae bacterium]
MSNYKSPSRRQFIKATGGIVAASALPSLGFANVHPQGSDMIQVALVGCGGRGSGAAVNALRTTSGPTKLVAMADVFEDRLKGSYDNIVKDNSKLMDVPA